MKSIIASFVMIAIIPLFLIAQLSDGQSKSDINQEIDRVYVSASNEFGFSILKSFILDDTSKNVFISPASIFLVLAMVANGAEGSTMHAIQNTLNFRDYPGDKMNSSSQQLMKYLMLPDNSVKLEIANSLWLNNQFKLNLAFTDDCERYYFAGCFVRDFHSPNTLSEINGWVNTKTKGKIPTILNELDRSKLLVILNAIYFDGKWTHPFKISQTKEKPFFLLNNIQKDYPRMYQMHVFDYYENQKYQAVNIPYGKRYSMYVVLPKQRNGLIDFIKDVDESDFKGMISNMRTRCGIIELPRFKINNFQSLTQTLSNLGMSEAFQDIANFSRMSDQIFPYISDVLHKTYLEVDEKGTKAVAVTSVIMDGETSAYNTDPTMPFVMIIDHPFFCAIRDNVTGMNIFVGAIFDPRTE